MQKPKTIKCQGLGNGKSHSIFVGEETFPCKRCGVAICLVCGVKPFGVGSKRVAIDQKIYVDCYGIVLVFPLSKKVPQDKAIIQCTLLNLRKR